MKYFVASDIHGDSYWAAKAVETFEAEHADRLVLLGDILYHGPRNDLPEDYQPDVKSKKIHIDQGDCESCGACLKRCPNKAIYFNENGLADVDYDVCLTCGYCAPVCPVRAIIMW